MRMRFVRGYVSIILGVFSLCAMSSADSINLQGSRHEDYRNTTKLEFPDEASGKVKSADEYLRNHNTLFKIPSDLSNLEVVGVRQSLTGSHTRYRQMLNGLPVEGAAIVISQRKADGSVFQVYNNTYPVETPVPVTKNIVSKDMALQKAWDHLHVYGSLKKLPKADLMYMPFGNGFRLVYKTLVIVDGPFGYWEHKVDALSGEVISVRRHEISEKYVADDVPDFSAYKGPVTSLQSELRRLEVTAQFSQKVAEPFSKTMVNATASVFDPDPRTTLGNDALEDNSPASSFNGAYFTRTLQEIALNSGIYYLQGPWVKIADLEAPHTSPSTTTNGIWTAKRGVNAFNDVMCYFHIDQNQRYLQSLGYTGATGIQEASLAVDSDGQNGDDNSAYMPSENYIAFGHGGVDDDEDADVILHEYGHAITQDIAPDWGGGDSGGIGEGFGDYWGASYSWTCPNGAAYHPEWAFSWDGHSDSSWSGRFLDMTNLRYTNSQTYDAHQTIGGIENYSDQLWGTPIYQAFRDLISLGRPRTEMDTIIIESFFGMGSGVKMRDMASATVKAAMELFPAGPHAEVYYKRFTNQSILVTYPLPDPTLTYPTGGEMLTTGSTIKVQWNRSVASVASNAVTRIEYNSQLTGTWSYFFDQVEAGTNGWVTSKTGSGSAWYITSSRWHSSSRSWFAADDAVAGDQFLVRSSISVSNETFLSFWHSYDLEETYDGAVVEISTNGTTWTDLGGAAIKNGYNSAIDDSYGSAIAGRSAFSGLSKGFVETVIPLSDYAGKTVSIRFRETDDSSDRSVGWWVDDIKIYTTALWSPVATASAGVSNYLWTLPGTAGTNYGIRIKLVVSNYAESAWDTSSAFTISRDIQIPILTISSPVTGSRLTNAVVTVTGRVTDNSGAADVLIRLNSGSWMTNNVFLITTNWTAGLTLIPGANTIRAYARDATGNSSLTSSVVYTYVVYGALTIQTNGPGTVTRLPAGVPEVGKTYTLTAVPAKAGSVFSSWSGDAAGTNKTVTFVMTSNKTVAANFTDTLKPTVTITYPTASMRVMTNGIVVLRGTAADNGGLGRVTHQLYTGTWTNAVTTNVWKKWTANFYPVSGLNTARVYSVDVQGNVSATSTVVFTYAPGAVMTVQTNGAGTITPAYNGKVLEIGKSYIMTAKALSGSVFSNWTYGISGPVATNKAAVTFVMQSNLVLTANFRSLLKQFISADTATNMPTAQAAITVDGLAKDWANVPRSSFSYASVTQEVAVALDGNSIALLLNDCPFGASDNVLVYFKLRLTYGAGDNRHSVDLWTSGSVLYGMVDGQVITGLEAVLLNGVLEVKLPVEQALSQVTIEEVACGMDLGDGTLTELFKTVPSRQ